MLSTNVFNELCVKITLQDLIKNLTRVCNEVYFWLCIDLMDTCTTPPVIAEGLDVSHQPRYAK